jgi:hypothetical protein
MILANIVIAVGILQSAGASRNPSAEAFVRHLYQREARETRADEDAFAGYKGAESIYSPSLLSLIRRDIRNAKGEVGLLDYDPICGCQDSEGLMVEALRIVATDASHVKTMVTIFPPGINQRQLTLNLVLLPQGWRVDDVEGPEGFRPLRALLTAKN